MSSPCVFCDIAAGRATAEMVREWDDVIAFVPLNPVVDGHVVVVPRVHVADVGVDPEVAAAVERRVSELVAELPSANVITSKGPAATQSVFHEHHHIVPRRFGDGLPLPWSGQQAAATSTTTVITGLTGPVHLGTGTQHIH